jgi:hypothetical protein
MSTIHRQYTEQLRKQFGYWATWAPGVPLKLGQIGTFQDGVFVPESDLGHLGIQFSINRDESPSDYAYQSTKGVSIQSKVKGKSSKAFQSLTRLDAGVGISFTKEGAVVFSARGCRHNRIDDEFRLKEELLALAQAGKWDYDRAVVTHVADADCCTVLVSQKSNSRVELRASADIGNELVDLADAKADLKVAFNTGMYTIMVSQRKVTPLFRAVRLAKSIFGPPGMVAAMTEMAPSGELATASGAGEVELEEVDLTNVDVAR